MADARRRRRNNISSLLFKRGNVKRRLRFFRQHSLETCGISCILMVLDYYRKVQYPTAKQERKLYALYGCRAFRGTLASSIADCLSKNRLKTEIYHSSLHFMDNRDSYNPEPLYQAILDEYVQTIKSMGNRVRVLSGHAMPPNWYRRQLDQGKLLIVQCIVPGNADGLHDETLHWILLYEYDKDSFFVCDPLSCKIRLSEQELIQYSQTPVGSICVTVSGEKSLPERKGQFAVG